MPKMPGAVELPRAPLVPRPKSEMGALSEESARRREAEEHFCPPGDRDDCARALHECLELLLSQESGDAAWNRQLLRPDSVASFLLWRRTRKPGAADTSALRNGEARAAERLERELREAREALELVTRSRAQALEDCERMSAQVTELTWQLQSVLGALSETHAAVGECEDLRNRIDRQARDIRVRDTLLAEMRETLQRMQAERSEQEISLAMEAERAREQLFERKETGSD